MSEVLLYRSVYVIAGGSERASLSLPCRHQANSEKMPPNELRTYTTVKARLWPWLEPFLWQTSRLSMLFIYLFVVLGQNSATVSSIWTILRYQLSLNCRQQLIPAGDRQLVPDLENVSLTEKSCGIEIFPSNAAVHEI